MAAAGTTGAALMISVDDRDVHAGAGLELLAGILGLHPDLNGGAVGVGGRTDDDHFALYGLAVSSCVMVAGCPTFTDAAWFCGTLTRATTREISITVNSGAPGRGHLAGVERTVGDHAGDRAEDLRVADLGLGRLQMAARRFHLRGGGPDLFLLADGLQRAQVLLGGEQCAVRLRVGHLRFVHQFARESALLEEFLAAVEQLLGGLLGLFGGIDVGLRFDYRSGTCADVMERKLASAWATCAWLSAAPAVRSRLSRTASSWPCLT